MPDLTALSPTAEGAGGGAAGGRDEGEGEAEEEAAAAAALRVATGRAQSSDRVLPRVLASLRQAIFLQPNNVQVQGKEV